MSSIGGETARSFYDRETAHTDGHPSADLLPKMSFKAKLEGARPDAVALLRSRVGEWIAETESSVLGMGVPRRPLHQRSVRPRRAARRGHRSIESEPRWALLYYRLIDNAVEVFGKYFGPHHPRRRGVGANG